TAGAIGGAVSHTKAFGQPQTSGQTDVTAPAPTSPDIERGRYLTALGDCIACHTRQGGQAFAGGRALQTPFGTLLSANITPDHATGIGSWTADQFYRALHEGI